MYGSILERRRVDYDGHSVVLEIPGDEYKVIYDGYNDDIAREILNNYLQYRSDDGRPSNISIQHDDTNNIVKIYANLEYLGNEHTTYKGHGQLK